MVAPDQDPPRMASAMAAFDDAREPTDRRHVASLAVHDKGPVELPIVNGSDMHAACVPFHQHGLQRHCLSYQPASDEF